MTIFEEIAELLQVPYYVAAKVIQKKDTLIEKFQEYDKLVKENQKCIQCGRPLERSYSLCDECTAAAKYEYIKYVTERKQNEK